MRSMNLSFHVTRKEKSLDIVYSGMLSRYNDLNTSVYGRSIKGSDQVDNQAKVFPKISLPKPPRYSQPVSEASSLHFHPFTPKKSPSHIKKKIALNHRFEEFKNDVNTTSESLDESLLFKRKASLQRTKVVKTRPQILSYFTQTKMNQQEKQNISNSVIIVCLDNPKDHLHKRSRVLSKKQMTIRYNILKKKRVQTLPIQKSESPLKFSISGWKAEESDEQ